MTLLKETIQAIYRRRARYYDFSVKLYWLMGLRHRRYRVRAVRSLRLKKGDRVVDLGCGTGLNFPFVLERIGKEGKLIGVDMSADMLARARQRIERHGWKNVELVQSDMTLYDFPKETNGVISSGAFGFVAEYDRVIETASHALAPGGRLVILDVKRPEHKLLWFFKFLVWISRPFGVTSDYFKGRPWESVDRHFKEATLEEMYGGMLYMSSGTA